MSKINNAYECDCCHELFRVGDPYDANAARGIDLALSVGRYGATESPAWHYEQVCDPCRKKVVEAIRAAIGAPTDEPKENKDHA